MFLLKNERNHKKDGTSLKLNRNKDSTGLTDIPDEELVRKAQGGDVPSFEKLFERHQRRVYNFIYQMMRNESEALDLTQETFVRAYKGLSNLKEPGAFGGWLMRIATNICRDASRKNEISTTSLEYFSDDEDKSTQIEIPDWSNNPERHAETVELQNLVKKAISTLSDDHKAVIVMHHLEGMEVSEIADALNTSVGTVKSRLARARAELKRKLGPYVESSI